MYMYMYVYRMFSQKGSSGKSRKAETYGTKALAWISCHAGSLRSRTGRTHSSLCPEAALPPLRQRPATAPSPFCPHPFVINTILTGCLEKHIFRGEWPGLRFGSGGRKIKEAPSRALPMLSQQGWHCEHSLPPAPSPFQTLRTTRGPTESAAATVGLRTMSPSSWSSLRPKAGYRWADWARTTMERPSVLNDRGIPQPHRYILTAKCGEDSFHTAWPTHWEMI